MKNSLRMGVVLLCFIGGFTAAMQQKEWKEMLFVTGLVVLCHKDFYQPEEDK